MPSHRGPRGLAGAHARDRMHDLAGAFALDALDERERRQFTRHLRGCPVCAAGVRGYQEVATALAFAASAEPPPELHDRVMAAVARTSQLSPRVAPWRRFAERLPRIPSAGWVPRLAAVTAAAAIGAVVVLSVMLADARQQLDTARAQSQVIAVVLAAPDVRTVAGPVTTGGVATVVLSAGRRELVVSTSGMAALQPGKTYELWLIGPSSTDASAIRPAGLLPVAVGGRTAPVLASGLVTGDKLGLTVEPSGGSRQPTTTPVLLLSLPGKT
jgi:anti-sigma factor RsiW